MLNVMLYIYCVSCTPWVWFWLSQADPTSSRGQIKAEIVPKKKWVCKRTVDTPAETVEKDYKPTSNFGRGLASFVFDWTHVGRHTYQPSDINSKTPRKSYFFLNCGLNVIFVSDAHIPFSPIPDMELFKKKCKQEGWASRLVKSADVAVEHSGAQNVERNSYIIMFWESRFVNEGLTPLD